MPELPEVETVRRFLQAQLPGQRLTAVVLRRPDLRYPIPAAAVHALVGSEIGEIRRRAKYLLMDVGPARVLVHLGMSGRLFVDDSLQPPEFRTHEHWRWGLDGPRGRQWLRYVDARRFGALDVVQAGQGHPLLDRLGPEPLEAAFSADHMLQLAQGRQVRVKQLLMDAAAVVGIGNIYASEACFRARISPLRPAGGLGRGHWQRLVTASKQVLQNAIAAGGSTLRDFASGDESPGYFQQQLDVYDRAGQHCTRCPAGDDRAVVRREVLGQRATFWCPVCQR